MNEGLYRTTHKNDSMNNGFYTQERLKEDLIATEITQMDGEKLYMCEERMH